MDEAPGDDDLWGFAAAQGLGGEDEDEDSAESGASTLAPPPGEEDEPEDSPSAGSTIGSSDEAEEIKEEDSSSGEGPGRAGDSEQREPGRSLIGQHWRTPQPRGSLPSRVLGTGDEAAPAAEDAPREFSARNSSNSPNSPNSPVEGTKAKPSTHDLHLHQYASRDLLHAAALVEQGERHQKLMRELRAEIDEYHSLAPLRRSNPAAVSGPGYSKYPSQSKTVLVYPKDRKRKRNTKELRLSRAQIAAQAAEPQALAPIRLDVDLDKYKIRDTFTWNVHEKYISVGYFAQTLVEDFEIPLSQHTVHAVGRAIQEQLADFHPHTLHSTTLPPDQPYHLTKDDDMRVLVRLDITIGPHHLLDTFEWDINNPDNDPEEFAQQMCADLALSGEFVTAIAHSIREQSQTYTKSLFLVGHPFDGRPIEDEGIGAHLMATIRNAIREPQLLPTFTPQLVEMSEEDLDRADNDRERETRRKRRQGRAGRRGAVQLPDLSEPIRTYRSAVINSFLPGAISTAPEIHEPVFDGVESDDDDDLAPRAQVNYPRLHRDMLEPKSLMVRLRIPRLRAFLAQRQLEGVRPPPASFQANHGSTAMQPGPPSQNWERLEQALAALSQKYPDDRFEISNKRQSLDPSVQRIKCLDCPGMLYIPGPGVTADNFEIHLRNRGHRERVELRLRGDETV